MAEKPAARRYPFLPADPEIGWTPYLWLVYVLQVPVSVWLGGGTARYWWLAVLSLSLFLPLYFGSYWVQGRTLLLIAAGQCALVLSFGVWNPGAAVFFIYSAASLGRLNKHVWRWLGGLLVLIAITTALPGYQSAFTMASLVFSLIVGAGVVHSAERRQVNRRLASAHEEIERLAQIAERERIARDLHDVLGHTLSLVVLKSELASRLASSDPARAAAEIADVERIAREALTQVRASVRGYRSQGLAAELDQARQTLASAGVRLENRLEPVPLSAAQESTLAMVIREGVTNIVRHARATECELSLRQEDGSAELRIADNGCGVKGAAEGLGLRGMRERVQALGGTLRRDSRSQGTELFICIPMRPA